MHHPEPLIMILGVQVYVEHSPLYKQRALCSGWGGPDEPLEIVVVYVHANGGVGTLTGDGRSQCRSSRGSSVGSRTSRTSGMASFVGVFRNCLIRTRAKNK